MMTVTSDERPQGLQSVPINRADSSKPYTKSGIVQLDWNITGNMLLVRYGALD